MPSVDGLVTGIDTASIIKGLLNIQQQQIDRIEASRQEALQQKAAVQSIEVGLAGLQTFAVQLGRAANNPLTRRVVNVSDETSLIATASSTAAMGTYTLRVNQLAQAHQVASQGVVDSDAKITQGTLQLRVGSRPSVTIQVDDSNDTLQGLADAINGANAGVTATIVRDAAGGATPIRLMLTATQPGADNAITLTNQLADSTPSAVRPQFDFDNPVQQARNASLTLGSGAGAINVESSSNEFRDVVAGVTFTALQADPGRTITVNVAPDVSSAQSAISDFVDNFNQLLDLIDTQTAYDPATDKASLLTGNRIVSEVQSKLRSTVLDVVPGANPQLNRLTALGISVTDKGRLTVNSARLTDVLSGRVNGVSTQDVQRLFALDGQSTNPGVRFLLGSNRTQASTAPYQVDITRAAARATLTGGAAVAGTTVVDSSNDTLALTLDGVSLNVALQAGSYTPQQLADELERATNAHPDLAGSKLHVAVAGGGALTLTSDSYGSSSRVAVTGGTALAALGLTAGQNAIGVDVAGQFVVNGVVEQATGSGRILTGLPDNAHTADLRVQVNLNASQVTSGTEAELTVTQGLAARLNTTLGQLLSANGGRMQSLNDQFQATVDSLQRSIDRQKATFEQQQNSLIQRFSAMESAISQLQSTAGFLGGQLAGLNSLKTG